MPRVRIARGYVRARRRLPTRIQEASDRALERFVEDPNRPGLNFERLQGWADHYSIRVTRADRILLRREMDEDGEVFVAVDVGTHRVYRR